MSGDNNSDSSTSESEVSACSSNYNPLKVLYSKKTKIPVENAPMYDNIQQFENAQKRSEIVPVGHSDVIKQREDEKKRKREQEEKELQEKNRQRFAQYEGLVTVRNQKKVKNVLTRIEAVEGPLSALKDCVDHRLRIKVITRSATTIRGEIHATLVAFDKQWNLALSDVLEVWRRKGPRKRKIPPGLGTPVPKGTAAKISPVPEVKEKPVGGGIWECSRFIPQLVVRGEHVVLINIMER